MRFLLLVCLVLSLPGCVSRGEIKAAIWLNNGSDPAQCGLSRATSPNPVLWDHGFYRRLDAGGFEFISFCDPRSSEWFAIYRSDLEEILNETLPREDAQAVLQALKNDHRRGAYLLSRRRR